MSITYKWAIDYMDTKQNVNDLPYVVVSCRWSVVASSDEGEERAPTHGFVDFGTPDPASFIAYDNLSEETVLNWVYASGVDKEAVEQELADKLAGLRSRPATVMANPWTNNN